MRTSYNAEFIVDENGEAVGFYFSNGTCAEHEFGIQKLKESFGIDDSLLGNGKRSIIQKMKDHFSTPNLRFGYVCRLITKCPENLLFVKYSYAKIKRSAMIFQPYYYDLDISDKKEIRKYLKRIPVDTRGYDKQEWISTAWSDKDFAIYAAGEENAAGLEKLYDAFIKNDIIMYVGNPTPNNPFSRGGLVFLIASKLDDEFKQNMYDIDYDHYQLELASADIIKKVRDAKLGYFALVPHWLDKEKGTLKFWLNPYDQQNNYFGWVTTSDLLDWVNGSGFIPGHGFAFEKNNREEFKRLVDERRKLFF